MSNTVSHPTNLKYDNLSNIRGLCFIEVVVVTIDAKGGREAAPQSLRGVLG